MSAYLKFFELEQSPFEGKAQARVVLGTKALRDACALIRAGLDKGDARICVSGGPGLGKTSLARALPKLLGDAARVAVVLDPHVPWESLRESIAKQWGLTTAGLARTALIEAASERRLVVVIDQAERASEEFLDHLDIVLSYRSENDEPVVQSILLARLSASDQQDPAPLVWWLDRIQTLQLEFAPLPRDGIESYIPQHRKRAGWRGQRLFTEGAALAIHEYTGGNPGEVSRLCERLLAEAATRDHHDIDDAFVHALCDKVEPEDESSLEDAFEEIVLGEEFDAAGGTDEPDSAMLELQHVVSDPERTPALSETLEHFEKDEAKENEEANTVQAADEIDETIGTIEAPLDGPFHVITDSRPLAAMQNSQDDPLLEPASQEELRAILGSVLGRHGRAFAAAAVAAVIGGLALAWLAGDAGPSRSSASDGPDFAGYERRGPTEPGATAESDPPPAMLARLRGPVSTTPILPSATRPAPATEPQTAPKTAPAIPSTEPQVLELSEEEFEEKISEDELVDMRPAAMLPGATQKSPSEERFW
jgi:type II secretory pathway predicted ATPase ExeA